MGTTASRNTSTPMPPSQWVKLRQYSSPLGMASTSVKMLEPVVVKPETVSKKQSMKLGMAPLKKKGSPPAKDTTTQHSATLRNPSRGEISFVRGGRKQVVRLRAPHSRMVSPAPKAASLSPKNREMPRGGTRHTASTRRI